jgi:small-conductance mechanosensitive channel
VVKSDLRFAIFKALQKEGIEIPFPQRTLHFANSPILKE